MFERILTHMQRHGEVFTAHDAPTAGVLGLGDEIESFFRSLPNGYGDDEWRDFLLRYGALRWNLHGGLLDVFGFDLKVSTHLLYAEGEIIDRRGNLVFAIAEDQGLGKEEVEVAFMFRGPQCHLPGVYAVQAGPDVPRPPVHCAHSFAAWLTLMAASDGRPELMVKLAVDSGARRS